MDILVDSYGAIAEFASPHPGYAAGYCSSVEQLQELWNIDTGVYGDCSIDFKTFQCWWSAYPQGSINIYCEGTIVASVGIYPLAAPQYEDFTAGRIREQDLRPLTEKQCEQTPQPYWYFSGIVISAAVKGDSRYQLLKLLLGVGIGAWSNRGHIAHPGKLIALGYSPEGERMLSRFGFLRHESVTLPDGCPLYRATVNSQKDILNQLKIRGI